MRLFSALRAFKYSDRYGLDFSDSLSRLIFSLYYDTKHISHKDTSKLSVPAAPYGGANVGYDTLVNMLFSFRERLETFSKMSTFKKEYAIYLLDKAENFPGIEKILIVDDPSSYEGRKAYAYEKAPF